MKFIFERAKRFQRRRIFLQLNDIFPLSPFQMHRRAKLTLLKIGQGHSRVMVYINFVELLSLMLHVKFQNHRPSCPEEVDFLRFLLFIAMTAIGNVIWTIYINFCSHFLWLFHMKFGFDWPSSFREKDV